MTSVSPIVVSVSSTSGSSSGGSSELDLRPYGRITTEDSEPRHASGSHELERRPLSGAGSYRPRRKSSVSFVDFVTVKRFECEEKPLFENTRVLTVSDRIKRFMESLKDKPLINLILENDIGPVIYKLIKRAENYFITEEDEKVSIIRREFFRLYRISSEIKDSPLFKKSIISRILNRSLIQSFKKFIDDIDHSPEIKSTDDSEIIEEYDYELENCDIANVIYDVYINNNFNYQASLDQITRIINIFYESNERIRPDILGISKNILKTFDIITKSRKSCVIL